MRTIESAIRQTRKAAGAVADICLYGTSQTGAGWLAVTIDKSHDQAVNRMFGTGEPKAGRAFTEAVWAACADLQAAGIHGTARVFEPSGTRMALVDIDGLVPAFGDLKWQAAPVYTISADDLIAAGKES